MRFSAASAIWGFVLEFPFLSREPRGPRCFLLTNSGRWANTKPSTLSLVHLRSQHGRLAAFSGNARASRRRLRTSGFNRPAHEMVDLWLNEDFGIGSALGHTVRHAHKTDACATCASYDVTIKLACAFLEDA